MKKIEIKSLHEKVEIRTKDLIKDEKKYWWKCLINTI